MYRQEVFKLQTSAELCSYTSERRLKQFDFSGRVSRRSLSFVDRCETVSLCLITG